MTDEELKELVASCLAVSQKETDSKIAELSASHKKLELAIEELVIAQKEAELKIAKPSGNYFDNVQEEVAFPPIWEVLEEQLGMDYFSTSVERRNKEEKEEWKQFGTMCINSEKKEAMIVKYGSSSGVKDVEELLSLLDKFPVYFTEHKDKKLYGMLVYRDFEEIEPSSILEKGIYLAQSYEEEFQLKTPAGFRPKSFHLP